MWNIELPPANWYTRQSRDLEALIREVADQKIVAIDTETTGLVTWKDIPLFWSMSWGERRVCMPADTLPMFSSVFADPDRDWVFANAKYDMHILANVGVDIKGRCVDTQIMHALLYEEKPHGLKDMANQVLGWKWMDFFSTFKRLKDESIGSMLLRFSRDDLPTLVEYASNDAYGTMKIYDKLRAELKGEVTHSLWPEWIDTLWDLFDKVEVKFTRVLWQCERNGIKVNFDYLKGIESHVLQVRNDVEKKIAKLAGKLLNPNSDHELRDYFFNHRGIKPLRLTSGGKSGKRQGAVDKAFLQHAAEMGEPMAELCLEHSALGTVINTYINGWESRADPGGRLHTRYNQDTVRSGRLSSSDPNLQNVKRVSEDPFKLRSAFVAPPGKKLIVGDYEQLEMRLLAAATVDPVTCPHGERDMIRIFEEGKDIHMGNASLVFKVPYEDIDAAKKIEKKIKEGALQDSDMTEYHHQCLFYRQAAKAIGFGGPSV